MARAGIRVRVRCHQQVWALGLWMGKPGGPPGRPVSRLFHGEDFPAWSLPLSPLFLRSSAVRSGGGAVFRPGGKKHLPLLHRKNNAWWLRPLQGFFLFPVGNKVLTDKLLLMLSCRYFRGGVSSLGPPRAGLDTKLRIRTTACSWGLVAGGEGVVRSQQMQT